MKKKPYFQIRYLEDETYEASNNLNATNITGLALSIAEVMESDNEVCKMILEAANTFLNKNQYMQAEFISQLKK